MLFEMHMSFYLVSPVLYIDRTSDFLSFFMHSIISCAQLNETRVTSSHSVLIIGDRIHHIKCALANGHSLSDNMRRQCHLLIEHNLFLARSKDIQRCLRGRVKFSSSGILVVYRYKASQLRHSCCVTPSHQPHYTSPGGRIVAGPLL